MNTARRASVFCHGEICFEQGVVGSDVRTKASVYDHESDSGLSGSLTDSGRALTDDVDAAAAGCAPGGRPYMISGSYCPARAADARRTQATRTTSQSNHSEQPRSCRRTRSTDQRTVELPGYDTYV